MKANDMNLDKLSHSQATKELAELIDCPKWAAIFKQNLNEEKVGWKMSGGNDNKAIVGVSNHFVEKYWLLF